MLRENDGNKRKMKCYCINCRQEQEMIVVDESINNRTREKKIKGYCKVCCDEMCLIEILVPSKKIINSKH